MKLYFIEDLENLQGEEKRVGTQPGWTSWLWWWISCLLAYGSS